MAEAWDDPDDAPPPDEPEHEAGEFPEEGEGALATVTQRALARFIDVFIAFNVGAGITYLTVGTDDDASFTTFVLITSIFFLIAGAYEVVLLSWRGQTVGKMLMGTRVARDADGDHPTPAEAAVRFAVPTAWLYLPSAFGQLIWVVVYLTAVPNPRRQGWHDRAAHTVVVRAR